jgi:hypothetical protein
MIINRNHQKSKNPSIEICKEPLGIYRKRIFWEKSPKQCENQKKNENIKKNPQE